MASNVNVAVEIMAPITGDK